MATKNFKVVVYGADLPGVFAAAKAAKDLTSSASDGKVALIVPYPKTHYWDSTKEAWVDDYLLGGIMTAGGLNYWDDRGYEKYWESAYTTQHAIQQGSYFYYRTSLGSGFDRVKLADKCKFSMDDRGVTVFYGQDIYKYSASGTPYKINSVTISPIHRDSSGRVVWTNTATQTTLTASVFIDASVESRIARGINSVCTTGRYSWPVQNLPADEKAATDYVGRQQAATLMIKMRNVNPTEQGKFSNIPNIGPNHTLEPGKPAALWVGKEPYEDPNGLIAAFNNKYKDSEGIMIKPVNAARNGNGWKVYNDKEEKYIEDKGGKFSEDWWVNALLVFNVDGRAHYRDEAANTVFKVNRKYNSMTTDEAWIKARNFVRNHASELEAALRTYNGFENASIVWEDGYPVVGDQLYIRETTHMCVISTNRAHGTTNSNYRVTKDAAQGAGITPTSGADKDYYSTRIGLMQYGCDIHPYQPDDLIKNGKYIWALESFNKMWKYNPNGTVSTTVVNPPNPMYQPYRALLTGYVSNLLIPGYGANICSFSWGEARVFSNLSVLGDAAGTAAAYSCNNNMRVDTIQNSTTAMSAVQAKIKASHGKIDK